MIFRIAWRNLREYRSRTLIIGVMVALGVTVLVVGNSVLESVTAGMKASYEENFTGDLIVRRQTDETVNFIGGGFNVTPPVLENFTGLTEHLETNETVARYTPLLTGSASLSRNDESLSFAFLWGIEPSSYFEMFPDRFTLTEGRRLDDGETGILLSQSVVEGVREEHGVTLRAGDIILLSGQNNTTGTKIREVTVRGIGQFENAVGLLENLSFVDAGTLRALTGLTAARANTTTPSSATDSDAAPSGDALFGGALFSETEPSSQAQLDYDNILGDTSERDRLLALDNNAWHFLLLELTEAGAAGTVTGGLEALPGDAVVETWRWGAGVIADLAFNLRAVLNLVIFVIAVVVVIIIMNTLVISVTERIGEIGTIRAIGGQKGFVRRMITTEVLTITLIFGLVGIGLGSLTVGLLNLLGLPANNLFLQILFGGSVLRPVLSVGALILSVVAVAVVGVVASLYPTSVALGVSPVQAMQKR